MKQTTTNDYYAYKYTKGKRGLYTIHRSDCSHFKSIKSPSFLGQYPNLGTAFLVARETYGDNIRVCSYCLKKEQS